MHIGIFAERFMGRYGADRVLIIIAEQLLARGHQVTLVGVRFSPAVVERFSQHTLRVPEFPRDQEAQTLAWFQDVQYFVRRKLPPFDTCIVGSFPFISAIPYLRTISRSVLFIDFGVVPTHGYPANIAGLIEGVRANRRANLRHASAILPISEFIAETQAIPESNKETSVETILLGADHLTRQIGTTAADVNRTTEPSFTRTTLDRLYRQERKLVLALGRWEPNCYKNSQACYDVMRTLVEIDPDVALLVMADEKTFGGPGDLYKNVFCIGLPTDAEMAEITARVDAGISVSTWEGFNLPVVEMQQQEKEVFAFNLAAHPEVVVSPDQLCANTEEMALKLYQALRDGGPPAWVRSGAVGPWREKFSWRRFGDEFGRVVERVA
jgi:glycosyltransferase involved in cell wall biosynthesis